MLKNHKFVTKLFASIDGYATQDKQHAIDLSCTAREIMKPLIEHHNGIWMHEKNGKIYVNFTAPEDAVNASVAIQQALQNDSKLSLRIGIHAVDFKTGITTGDAVASGIAEMTASGGVCVSDTVYSAIQDRTDIKAEYLKDMKLEGVERNIRVYALTGEGLAEPASADDHVTASKPQPSIAVLPFINMSADPEQEYFCDGMTEEIINALTHVEDLKVIARTSAFAFKGEKIDIREIGSKLDVETLLEGSVRKAGNKLRITAQLIKVEDGSHLFSERFDREMEDVFEIQDEISLAIVDALKAKLAPKENVQLTEHQIDNVMAYEYYLKANEEIYTFTEDSINHAIQYLNHAIKIIGDNALLYASMAFAQLNLVNIGVKQEDYLAIAEENAKKSLLINPQICLAHNILGLIDFLRGKVSESLFRVKKALEINNNDANALLMIVTNYLVAGKISAAIPYLEKVILIDPLSVPTNWCNGAFYFYDGKFNLALQEWKNFYELHPQNPYSQFEYALILTYNHEIDKAIPIIDYNAKKNPTNVIAKLGLILKYAINDDKERILQEMTPDFQKTCKRDATSSPHLASFLSLVNQKKDALDWLEIAINRGFINYPFLNEYDPFLENIRGEERFKKLMERVKYEWENFEV
ncbi:hypothetical protein ACFL2X_06740 [Candidatus Latescibacterota bacterium]